MSDVCLAKLHAIFEDVEWGKCYSWC